MVFDKNVFAPNERCVAETMIDNDHCNLAINSVRLAVEQDLEIECGNHRFRQTFNLTDKHEIGVGAHEKGNRNLDLNLSTIKYDVVSQRKKKE